MSRGRSGSPQATEGPLFIPSHSFIKSPVKSRTSPTLACGGLALTVIVSCASAASITSVWKSNFDGNFENPDNWTNSSGGYAFPNNGTNTYDASINLTGSPAYNVLISSPVTVSKLTV